MSAAQTPGKVWASLGAAVVAIVAGVVAIEGGYVNDRNDAGGETNHGITAKVLTVCPELEPVRCDITGHQHHLWRVVIVTRRDSLESRMAIPAMNSACLAGLELDLLARNFANRRAGQADKGGRRPDAGGIETANPQVTCAAVEPTLTAH